MQHGTGAVDRARRQRAAATWRRVAIGCAWLVSIALGGCAGLRLHSETRDQQGQAAVKAWSEVDLKAFFAAERANDDKLLQQELATAARRIATDREGELRVLAAEPLTKLPDRFDTRLAELAGPEKTASATDAPVPQATDDTAPAPLGDARRAAIANAVDAASNALRHVAAHREALERDLSLLAQLGSTGITCEAAGDAVVPPTSTALLKSVKSRCESIASEQAKHRAALAVFADGPLRSLSRALERAEQRQQGDAAALADKQQAHRAALAAYQAALAQADPGAPASQALVSAAATLHDALSAIESIGGILSAEFVAQQRLARIDQLLGDLAARAAPAADASKLEAAALLLPELADDAQALAIAGKRAWAVPLLIRRDIEQARLDQARLQIEIARTERELLVAQIASTLAEMHELVKARKAFDKPSGLSTIDRPLAEAWPALSQTQRFAALESIGLYLDAIGRQRNVSESLLRSRLALAKQQAAAQSQVNADLWASLIGATVGQAADFAATGITAADLERLVSALGLLWIGHGVNQ